MKDELRKIIKEACKRVGIGTEFAEYIKIDYPEDPIHGDFSTNIALACSKALKTSSKELADKIVAELDKSKPEFVKEINIAGPGFINFFIKDVFLAERAIRISDDSEPSGKRERRSSTWEILIEYTDPNAFKVFHIGHLMSNAIGESISRLIEYSGAEVKRICYPSDIGLHIAKAIWAVRKHVGELPNDSDPIQDRTAFLGKMYVEGTNSYDADPQAKKEIDALNALIYEKSDTEANDLYEKGRKWSMDHFEELYKILGTKFDDVIYESEMAPVGLEIVKKNIGKSGSGVFEESEGAVVFRGEDHGLHTRVFINSNGLPTYEAKDVGLNVTKFKKYPDAEQSIIVTASEQNDYFKVLLKVLSLIDKKNGKKTKHIGHGMMRFASGKMSSRTGNVVTAESLLSDIKKLVGVKIAGRKFTEEEANEISEVIAVAAIKYSILRSAIGGDIVFDSAASISFEGDSGPYLQYSAVRARSVLEKAESEGMVAGKTAEKVGTDSKGEFGIELPDMVENMEKLLVRFSDVAERAEKEFAPQHVAGYLINLAGTFNSFYASQIIIDKNNPLSPYYIALTKAFLKVMTDGLWILGINVPKKM